MKPKKLTNEKWGQWNYEVNVFGVMRMCKAFIPLLRKSRVSTIVQISSLSGIITTPYSGVYSATKFALEAYSDAMRAELSKQGIRVVSVQPGYFESEISNNSKKLKEKPNEIFEKNYPKFGKRAPLVKDPLPVAQLVHEAIKVKRPWPAYTVGGSERYLALFLSNSPKFVQDLLRNTMV